ncbi:hypothetical protein D7V97_22060, partial [Corallococcus sp. CA053C]
MRSVLFCVWLFLLRVSVAAHAASYEVDPEDTGEQALFALREDGAITAETLAALTVLRRSGVDPVHASRASLYGLPGLTYARVDGLRGDGALTVEERRRLAPFLTRTASERVSGDARLLSAFAASDPVLPPWALQVRVAGPEGWRVGLLTSLTRRRLGAVHRDARPRTLVAEAPGVSVVVPKFHGQWTGERASVLVGSYRLGFGQRLTLDTTGLPTPDGFLPDDVVRAPGNVERWCFLGEGACAPEERAAAVTPDFQWDEGFRGVVGTVRG